MIAGISPQESIDLFSHSNGTTPKDVATVLHKLGFKQCRKKLIPFAYQKQLPDICMICIRWDKKGGHWVVYNHGFIYCPGDGVYQYSLKAFGDRHGKAHSFLMIGERNLS